MAQSNSAQREPSMEEILASIRRIIEDSDTARKPSEQVETPTVKSDAAEPNNVHAFRLGLHEAPEPDASLAGGQEAPSVSVSGGASSWNEWSRPGANAAEFTQTAQSSGANGPSDDVEMDLSLDDFSDRPADEHGEDHAGGEQRPAIMSDHAGRQVAASFSELSAAFEARSRKTFDEMAEEMLRPMLQDWLDNNLPHLVERLVREEIERIARGAAAPR